MARVHSYLNIMIEHFTNMAVYAVIIEDIIDTTVNKFPWNHNIILLLNKGTTAIMHTEIWKRFLMAREEIFKTEDKTFMLAIKQLEN